MKYTPANLEDKIEALEDEYMRRQEVLTLADALYDKLDPFQEDFPSCAEAILTALEDNYNDLYDWIDEPLIALRELGHW